MHPFYYDTSDPEQLGTNSESSGVTQGHRQLTDTSPIGTCYVGACSGRKVPVERSGRYRTSETNHAHEYETNLITHRPSMLL